MRLLTFTVTNNPLHPGAIRLAKSALFWGWDLKFIHQDGWNRSNYRAEQLGQLEAIQSFNPEYVLYLDAWDTIFTGPPQELPLRHGMLSFCGDTTLHPWEGMEGIEREEQTWYPHVGEHEFRFVNAGVIWGDARILEDLALDYLDRPAWLVNQDYLNRRYAFEDSVGKVRLQVDQRAKVALNLMLLQKRYYEFSPESSRVEYIPSRSRPLVLHSPGTGLTKPLAPMPEELEKLYA